ncbi:hypothetical protein BBJ28_00018224 [Nothophytophthora sp. Chile5]|nr:hypothetical protein BBJ28_00018224 [Nothophytophthora sp. Chile5]
MEERWRGGSTKPADKAIPVALYPGERVGQCTYKFKRWLVGKDVPLASLAQDPNKERSLWHTGKQLPTNDDIQRQAVVNFAKAVRLRVGGGDPEERRLTETYNHLHGQIGMNETAIDGALTYVKATKDVDAARALEHHNQIMELCISINKEKEKR